jgi:Domain of unknown function (DUF222)/HNH endonuclease
MFDAGSGHDLPPDYPDPSPRTHGHSENKHVTGPTTHPTPSPCLLNEPANSHTTDQQSPHDASPQPTKDRLEESPDRLLNRLSSVDTAFDDVLTGLAQCDATATLTLARHLARLTARLEGITIHTHVHLARHYPVHPDLDDKNDPYPTGAADELAAALEQSPRTISSRLAQAWDLAHDLPAALADLTAGLLDHTRLAALHQLTTCLTPEHRAHVETAMLAGSRLASPPRWRRKIHRLIARLDPHAAAKRRKEAHTERRTWIDPLNNGMAQLTAIISAEDAHAIYNRINQITRHDKNNPEDTRTIDARRTDILTALLLGNRREHVHVEIQVIAPVGTLAGLDDNPMELAGYGPIPADVGRALAADAHWRRILTDPQTGTVLDLGHRRIPTPTLARLVRHQQGRCLFPGCGTPASKTDIDHITPHAKGGPTAIDNLALLCRKHHRAKHRNWALEQTKPGIFQWTSPTHNTYQTDTTHNDEEGHRTDEPTPDWMTIPRQPPPRHDHTPAAPQPATNPEDCPF